MNIKKCACTVLAIMSTFLFSAMSVSAAGVIPEKPISNAELIAIIQSDSSYTPEQKQAMINKVKRSENGPMPRSFSARQLNNYPKEVQEGNFWCVPANVRMVIRYKGYKVGTQAEIAKALNVDDNAGVPLSDAVPYLNRNAATDYIWQYKPDSLARYQTNIDDTLSTKKPVLLSTKFTTAMGYPYNSNRYYHAISIIGQSVNAANYTMRDPTNVGDYIEYTVSAKNAYDKLDHYIW